MWDLHRTIIGPGDFKAPYLHWHLTGAGTSFPVVDTTVGTSSTTLERASLEWVPGEVLGQTDPVAHNEARVPLLKSVKTTRDGSYDRTFTWSEGRSHSRDSDPGGY